MSGCGALSFIYLYHPDPDNRLVFIVPILALLFAIKLSEWKTKKYIDCAFGETHEDVMKMTTHIYNTLVGNVGTNLSGG